VTSTVTKRRSDEATKGPAVLGAPGVLAVSTPQLKRLHAIGRQLGLDHEALRDAAGVASLKQLTRAQAAHFIDQLEAPHATPRVVNSPYADASKRQRQAIWAKLKQLHQQCRWSSEKCAGWLQRRYGIEHPYVAGLQSGQASDILDALDNILTKETAEAPRAPRRTK
jgi:hypothetical protein